MRTVLTPAARRDIVLQAAYLAEDAYPSVALRFIHAAKQTVGWVGRHPSVGSAILSRDTRLNGMRRWPIKGFEAVWIYYQTIPPLVRIVRVLHGRRDVRRMLRL